MSDWLTSVSLSFACSFRFETCLRALGVAVTEQLPYIGRPSSAVPATGFSCLHKEEERAVLDQALELPFLWPEQPEML